MASYCPALLPYHQNPHFCLPQQSCNGFQRPGALLPAASVSVDKQEQTNSFLLYFFKSKGCCISQKVCQSKRKNACKYPHLFAGFCRYSVLCTQMRHSEGRVLQKDTQMPHSEGRVLQKEVSHSPECSLVNYEFPSSKFGNFALLVEKARIFLATSESNLNLTGIFVLVLFSLGIAAAARGPRYGVRLGHTVGIPFACVSSSMSHNVGGSSSTLESTDVAQHNRVERSEKSELCQKSEKVNTSMAVGLDVEVEDKHFVGNAAEECEKDSEESAMRNVEDAEIVVRKDDLWEPSGNPSYLSPELRDGDENYPTEATENAENKKSISKAEVSGSSFEGVGDNEPLQERPLGYSGNDAAETDPSSTSGQLCSIQGSSSQFKHHQERNEVHDQTYALKRMDDETSIDPEARRSSKDPVAGTQQDLWPWKRKDMAISAADATTRIARQKDKELELAYEEWMARPYSLTVPLKIVALRASVPYVWLKEFLRSQGKRTRLSVEFQRSLRDMITDMVLSLENSQLKKQSVMAADLVTVGDAWLGSAIMGGLIEPISNINELDWFQHLGPRWQNFLRRDESGQLDPQGMVWAVPYRWGCTVIAYRKDKFAKANLSSIKDWRDIWRPELAAKVSMVDSPREVVGAVLKSLGASYNCKNFNKEVVGGREAVKQHFAGLQKQVRMFDSKNYLKALGAGDVWVAVGWSSDVIPFARRMSNIAVVVPNSGSSLWADLWAIPAVTTLKSDKVGSRIRGPSPLTFQWLDFCLQPARALSFKGGLFAGDSPLLLAKQNWCCINSCEESKEDSQASACEESKEDSQASGEVVVPKASNQITHDKLEGFMSQESIERSEFIEPLSKQAMDDYEWLLSDNPQVEGWPNDLWELLKGAFQLSWSKVPSAGVRF
ncbi:hypothetical protein O6H91_04G036000 [Diphasiastrum complanatum]|uniref:Uncharacterized protein n=2 Tax=Diphasiastrum complanatum TaxID=34168 RepID=A0ACC2DW38_DIPCM|nr:hypothetical protein O6H91_04G036000 [Diphasiastrum complanatum]